MSDVRQRVHLLKARAIFSKKTPLLDGREGKSNGNQLLQVYKDQQAVRPGTPLFSLQIRVSLQEIRQQRNMPFPSTSTGFLRYRSVSLFLLVLRGFFCDILLISSASFRQNPSACDRSIGSEGLFFSPRRAARTGGWANGKGTGLGWRFAWTRRLFIARMQARVSRHHEGIWLHSTPPPHFDS